MKLRFSGISWGRASFPGSDSLSLSSSSFDLGFFPQKKVTPSEKHHLKNLVFFLVGDFFTSFCTMEKKTSNHHLRELYAFIYIYNQLIYIYIYIYGASIQKYLATPYEQGAFFFSACSPPTGSAFPHPFFLIIFPWVPWILLEKGLFFFSSHQIKSWVSNRNTLHKPPIY